MSVKQPHEPLDVHDLFDVSSTEPIELADADLIDIDSNEPWQSEVGGLAAPPVRDAADAGADEQTPAGPNQGAASSRSVGQSLKPLPGRLPLARLIPLGLSAIVAPFLLGYRKTAPHVAALHIVFGIGVIVASLFTDYRAYAGIGKRAAA